MGEIDLVLGCVDAFHYPEVLAMAASPERAWYFAERAVQLRARLLEALTDDRPRTAEQFRDLIDGARDALTSMVSALPSERSREAYSLLVAACELRTAKLVRKNAPLEDRRREMLARVERCLEKYPGRPELSLLDLIANVARGDVESARQFLERDNLPDLPSLAAVRRRARELAGK